MFIKVCQGLTNNLSKYKQLYVQNIYICIYLSGIVTDRYFFVLNKQYAVNYAVGQAGISVHLPPYKVCICSIYKILIMELSKLAQTVTFPTYLLHMSILILGLGTEHHGQGLL